MSKHTPGPWTASGRGDYGDLGGNSVVIHGRNDCCRIAVVHHHGYEEDDANVNLIAAAPELLDATKLAVFEFERDGEVFRDAIRAMKRAIAKAEGRTN